MSVINSTYNISSPTIGKEQSVISDIFENSDKDSSTSPQELTKSSQELEDKISSNAIHTICLHRDRDYDDSSTKQYTQCKTCDDERRRSVPTTIVNINLGDLFNRYLPHSLMNRTRRSSIVETNSLNSGSTNYDSDSEFSDVGYASYTDSISDTVDRSPEYIDDFGFNRTRPRTAVNNVRNKKPVSNNEERTKILNEINTLPPIEIAALELVAPEFKDVRFSEENNTLSTTADLAADLDSNSINTTTTNVEEQGLNTPKNREEQNALKMGKLWKDKAAAAAATKREEQNALKTSREEENALKMGKLWKDKAAAAAAAKEAAAARKQEIAQRKMEAAAAKRELAEKQAAQRAAEKEEKRIALIELKKTKINDSMKSMNSSTTVTDQQNINLDDVQEKITTLLSKPIDSSDENLDSSNESVLSTSTNEQTKPIEEENQSTAIVDMTKSDVKEQEKLALLEAAKQENERKQLEAAAKIEEKKRAADLAEAAKEKKRIEAEAAKEKKRIEAEAAKERKRIEAEAAKEKKRIEAEKKRNEAIAQAEEAARIAEEKRIAEEAARIAEEKRMEEAKQLEAQKLEAEKVKEAAAISSQSSTATPTEDSAKNGNTEMTASQKALANKALNRWKSQVANKRESKLTNKEPVAIKSSIDTQVQPKTEMTVVGLQQESLDLSTTSIGASTTTELAVDNLPQYIPLESESAQISRPTTSESTSSTASSAKIKDIAAEEKRVKAQARRDAAARASAAAKEAKEAVAKAKKDAKEAVAKKKEDEQKKEQEAKSIKSRSTAQSNEVVSSSAIASSSNIVPVLSNSESDLPSSFISSFAATEKKIDVVLYNYSNPIHQFIIMDKSSGTAEYRLEILMDPVSDTTLAIPKDSGKLTPYFKNIELHIPSPKTLTNKDNTAQMRQQIKRWMGILSYLHGNRVYNSPKNMKMLMRLGDGDGSFTTDFLSYISTLINSPSVSDRPRKEIISFDRWIQDYNSARTMLDLTTLNKQDIVKSLRNYYKNSIYIGVYVAARTADQIKANVSLLLSNEFKNDAAAEHLLASKIIGLLHIINECQDYMIVPENLLSPELAAKLSSINSLSSDQRAIIRNYSTYHERVATMLKNPDNRCITLKSTNIAKEKNVWSINGRKSTLPVIANKVGDDLKKESTVNSKTSTLPTTSSSTGTAASSTTGTVAGSTTSLDSSVSNKSDSSVSNKLVKTSSTAKSSTPKSNPTLSSATTPAVTPTASVTPAAKSVSTASSAKIKDIAAEEKRVKAQARRDAAARASAAAKEASASAAPSKQVPVKSTSTKSTTTPTSTKSTTTPAKTVTPAKSTPTPAKSTPTPAKSTPAPAKSTPAKSTPAKTVTPAPTKSAPAPTKSTPAKSTPAPTKSTKTVAPKTK